MNQKFEYDIENNYAVCPNGAMYRKDIHGFLPQLMQSKYDERVNWKKLQLATEQEYEKTGDSSLKNTIAKAKIFQMAKKIQLNSLLMVLSEINTFDTINSKMLKQSQRLVKFLFAGLRKN